MLTPLILSHPLSVVVSYLFGHVPLIEPVAIKHDLHHPSESRLRDQSLITGRRGGLQNWKIMGPELFAPTPLKTGTNSLRPPPFFF